MVNRYYRKGYRVEREAMRYMEKHFSAICIRSAGSHSPIDLICGNGKEIYAVQVKAGKTLPYVDWENLERYAKYFNAKPLVLYKPDYRDFVEIWSKSDLSKVRRNCKR